MALLARLFLPAHCQPSRHLPAWTWPAEELLGRWALLSQTYNSQPGTISRSAGQWWEKPKRCWLPKHPHFIHHLGLCQTHHPAAQIRLKLSLSWTELHSLITTFFLSGAKFFECSCTEWKAGVKPGWSYKWSQSPGPCMRVLKRSLYTHTLHMNCCKVMLCHVSAQTHCIIAQLRLVFGQAESWFRWGSPISFQGVRKQSPCEIFAVGLGTTRSCLVLVPTPQLSLLTTNKQRST